ncbi:hypothetical protein BASA81_012738 [Batrachochytrium salamandrivorans]|nr:hypothetical protein BASA81_012738 [Batrachochytrium salamandrivorans]
MRSFVLLLAMVLALAAKAQTEVYSVGAGTEVQCTSTVSNNRVQGLGACSSTPVKLRAMRKVSVPKSQRKRWKTVCIVACLKTKGCASFTAPGSKSSCQLFGNPSGCGLVSLKKVKRDTNTKVVLAQDCFEPYTRPPTPKPTAAPIPRCDLPTSSPFYEEFQSLEYGPRVVLFAKVQPSSKLCEYVRLSPRGTFNTIENFTCTVEACIRWCEYTPNCRYAQYNPVAKTCMRADSMQLTDDSLLFKPYFTDKIETYMHTIIGEVQYFNGRCNEFVKSYCNQDKECGWNRGKKGVNDQTQGGSASGYCGRIKCNKGF